MTDQEIILSLILLLGTGTFFAFYDKLAGWK